tara:strand:+ start:284642 stop:284899 length:258 start_codon:yes stop_codon:yes gene_type:complete
MRFGVKPITEPVVKYHLKQAMASRRKHRDRARAAQRLYDADPTIYNKLRLMQAIEASRGSRISARRLHEKWEPAVKVVRRVGGFS